MGIRRPGFQLLSLVSPLGVPSGTPTFQDVPCLLPDQLNIYLSNYVPLLAVSVLALFISNVLRVSQVHKSWSRGHLRTRSPTDEEEVRLWGSAPPPLPRALHVHDEEDEDDEERCAYDLPLTPVVAITGKGRRGPSCLSRVGRLRTVRQLATYVCGCRGRDAAYRRGREGLLRGFWWDLLEVAWVPVVLFVAIAWWMFL